MRTITAMYDDRNEAESAREELRSSMGVDARIVDQSSSSASSMGGSSGSDPSSQRYADTGYSPADSGSSNSSSSGGGRGFWAELKDAFVSDEDRHSYEEGVRRGGFLLTASVSEDQADRACDILDKSSSVDFDSRENQWRQEGWQGYQPRQATGSTSNATGSASSAMGASSTGMTGERGNATEEQRIPIIEEQLRVGKREVSRGGARVRSYVEEVPVDESVSLREEHVNVERRPVDRKLDAAELKDDGLLQGRTIEMRETAEEAVVGKEARVKEEVVVSKTATERTEQIHDTVRHTKVDVEEGLSDADRTRADGDSGALFNDKR